ncbi:MAG: hypothetical protein QOE58_119 [Actinomycetota bacterium]|jgi:hypothetical protein|nr:hypothetical protein [Actinomycetota bacterium]
MPFVADLPKSWRVADPLLYRTSYMTNSVLIGTHFAPVTW